MSLESAIGKINSAVSGLKYIAKKFDNLDRIWIMSRSSSSSTTYYLLVFDLNGDAISNLVSFTYSWVDTIFTAIDNYAIILTGTASSTPYFRVWQLSGSTLSSSPIKTSPVAGKYPNPTTMYAYKEGTTYYVTLSTEQSKTYTPLLYNLTANTVSYSEVSTQHILSLYFLYVSGSGIRGLMWNHNTNTTLYNAGYKFESSASGLKSLPGSPLLSGHYFCYMHPVLNYTNSFADIKYELFTMNYTSGVSEAGTCTNVVFNSSFTTITTGSITITSADDPFKTYGMLIYDGKYYSYNATSGNIELIYSADDGHMATRTEAVAVGGSGTGSTLLVLYSELGTYGCKAYTTQISYTSLLCVRYEDLYKNNTGGITSFSITSSSVSGKPTNLPLSPSTDMIVVGKGSTTLATVKVTVSTVVHQYLSNGDEYHFNEVNDADLSFTVGGLTSSSDTSFTGTTLSGSLSHSSGTSYTGTITPTVGAYIGIKFTSSGYVFPNLSSYSSASTLNTLANVTITVDITF